jgi:hypothetical protein
VIATAQNNKKPKKIMEQVLFFYDAIDRNAIVVIPKKPYFDWANNIFDDNQQLTEHENNIYLISEKEST